MREKVGMRPSTGQFVSGIVPRRGIGSSGHPGASGGCSLGFVWRRPGGEGRRI